MGRILPLAGFCLAGLLSAVIVPDAGGHEPHSDRKVISAPDAPAAIGPYSQAILVGDTLYISGQLPLDPVSGVLAAGDIRTQTARVIANIKAILGSAGLSLEDVVQTQVFLVDLDDFSAMNEVYADSFSSRPARATVQVARLPRDARIEILAVAVRRKVGQ